MPPSGVIRWILAIVIAIVMIAIVIAIVIIAIVIAIVRIAIVRIAPRSRSLDPTARDPTGCGAPRDIIIIIIIIIIILNIVSISILVLLFACYLNADYR